MGRGEPHVRVVVVDDESGLAELYRQWLPDEWETTVATDGTAGLAAIDGDTDLVVLDRRMPDCSGDELLTRLSDRAPDPQVVMVTAVEPDFDIVGLGIDDYLVKPVDRETLRDCCFRLQERLEYDERLQELFSLASKQAVLEASKEPSELRASEEYQRLRTRVERKRSEVDSLLDDISRRDGYDELFRGLFSPAASR